MIVTGKIRAEPRAPGGYRDRGQPAFEVVQRVPEAEPYPIQLKEHGVDFLLDQRHLWIRTPRQAAILRIRAEAIRAAREFMDYAGLHADRRADLHAGRVRRHDHAFRSAVHRRRESLPDAVRAALRRGHGRGAGQGLHVRAHVSRGKIEDAPPPDRILDARARSRLRAPGRHDGAGRRAWSATWCNRCCGIARANWKRSGATSSKLRSREAAVSAHHLRRGAWKSCGSRAIPRSGATISAATKRRCFRSNTTGR